MLLADTLSDAKVQTARGPVLLTGRFGSFRADRPLLLMIRGAFPDRDQFSNMPERLPAADVALAHLPVMHSPFLSESSVLAFAAAFDEAVEATFPGRAVNVVGSSAGGLAAIGMRHPLVRRLLLLDTPLTTAGRWPLRDMRAHAGGDPALEDWVHRVFGLGPGGVEPRDYRPLLNGVTAAAAVLVGGDPLGQPRLTERMPSLVCDEDRAAYVQRGFYLRTLAGVGHNVPRDGFVQMMEAIHGALV